MRHVFKGAAIAAAAAFWAFGMPASAQLTDDIAFNVVNNTDQTITALYISSTDDSNWGHDIAVDYIAPGQTMEVDITDNLPGCEYDVRVDFSGGHSMQLGAVNLCEINGQTVNVTD